MLGEYVTWLLVLVLGYAYPAFECFRAIEQNKPEIEQLRFWCQYWIIMGLLTALERFGDMFVSWLPLYDEAKLAFIIYLWHPKTKGTWYIYNAFFMPCLAKHEPRINRRLQEIRTKSGDLLLFYIKNFTEKGQSLAFDFLQYVVGQASGTSASQASDGCAPPPPRPADHPSRGRRTEHERGDHQNGGTEIERILRDGPFDFLKNNHRRRRD
uniref:HVA22-like protein n=1 Tax=Anthurium amnicola TaxID=1678845 RepID=A0A1D1YFN9_9ARAE